MFCTVLYYAVTYVLTEPEEEVNADISIKVGSFTFFTVMYCTVGREYVPSVLTTKNSKLSCSMKDRSTSDPLKVNFGVVKKYLLPV